jgi:hydroxymethylbilane synthase
LWKISEKLHWLFMPLRLGTRASALAQWQAQWVAAQLRLFNVAVELVPITTTGDVHQEPLSPAFGTGVFTKEIQRALLDGRIDLAVHSMKDLPTCEAPGLCLAAIPERAPVDDALICLQYDSLSALPPGAVIGTGSLRRRAQLLNARGDLHMKDIRGNVDTRLQKLDRGEYDALVLAHAGLQRLNLAKRISQLLPISIMLPAVGQGALALETRSEDRAARDAVAPLDHPGSRLAAVAERTMLAALQGGCLAPIAAWARIEEKQLVLAGRVLSSDGQKKLEVSFSAAADATAAASLGRRVADDLLSRGAAELIQTSRYGNS